MEWRDHVEQVLHRRGLKRGGARERVIALLATEPCALSAAEIERSLRHQGTPTGRATIYRALELLDDHGLVERLEVGDGQARYERVHPSGRHHHHLMCEGCGELVAFDDPELERVIERLARRLGATVEGHEVLLRGSCPGCRQRAEA